MKLTRCWAFKIWTRTDLTDADIPEFLKPKFSFLFALSLFSDEDDSWFFLYLCPKSSNGVPRRKGVARYFDTVQPHQRPNSNRTRVIRKSKYKYQQQLQFFGSSIFIRVVFFNFSLRKTSLLIWWVILATQLIIVSCEVAFHEIRSCSLNVKCIVEEL